MSLNRLLTLGSKHDLSMTGDWTDSRKIWFVHDHAPYDVKFAVEKMTGLLLEREGGTPLCYAGLKETAGVRVTLRLRFHAVMEGEGEYRNLFSLSIDTAAPKKWYQQDGFLEDAVRAFEYWGGQLEQVPEEMAGDASTGNGERYAIQIELATDREFEAAMRVEDFAGIAKVQLAVLDALRQGLYLGSCHHEGGTRLFFSQGKFWREDFGMEPGREEYRTPEEMILSIRNFFDWDSRRAYYPHRPPELDVWKYIENALQGGKRGK